MKRVRSATMKFGFLPMYTKLETNVISANERVKS